MDDATSLFIGQGQGGPRRLVLSRANRHGLIAGATGTGKTAEQMVRQVGRSLRRQMVNRIAGTLVRGLLGGLFKGR